MKSHRAVFLDLNGTLVLPLKQDSLDEMTLISGADVAITRLLAFGFVCPVVTVQARIEKGLFTEAEFRAWFADFFGNLGLDVKGPYVCPHRYSHPCPCEKPKSLLNAKTETRIKRWPMLWYPRLDGRRSGSILSCLACWVEKNNF